MRLELLGPAAAVADTDVKRDIGAVVARPTPAGGVLLEFGPADGPPRFRLTVSNGEAVRLAATLHAVANGRGEEIVITEP